MRHFNNPALGALAALAAGLRATMVAATAVAVADRPGMTASVGTFTLDPGSIAAGGREVETIAIPGARVGDILTVAPRQAMSLVVGYTRVTGNDAAEFALENNTAGAVDLAAGTWDYRLERGSSGPIRS